MKKSRGIVRRIQDFMDTARGKTILNYLYSWGAAIVILGTLFKLTHMEGANIMLFVGMGTEVIVFFFSAFERPYDIAEEEKKEEEMEEAMARTATGQPIIINGPIVAGGGSPVAATPSQEEITGNIGGEARPAFADGNAPVIIGAGASPATGGFAGPVPAGPMPVANAENITEMDKVTEEYVEQVRVLNEAIQRISQQTEALGRNMEEMETLSRNLTGVNALYEVQLRSAGGQLSAIDQVNEQTKKMAEQIEELNSIYARMIEAMTSNMNRQQA